MSDKKKIELFDVGVAETSGGIAPALVLKSEDKFLPIYVGLSEAISANNGLKNEDSFRPFAHDIILKFLDKNDVKIDKVIIDDLEEEIYFAQIVLRKNGEKTRIDARPSDSIALAVRKNVDIKIKKSILKDSSKSGEEIKEKMNSLDNYL
ncbi:hypothetical protein C9439_03250 [archaeon SCG-AAA382B04]|nr:hypothetical protein C9439_03250 [archaeon SCG-AAA382B04]